MVANISSEAKLYPIVEKWMKKQFLCFKTATNTGLRHSRLDVVGVRDVGGDLSGEIETISIEVKNESEPFATSCGQALGYKIYANRVYLADVRKDVFTNDEIRIASHLGIGLIQIQKNLMCKEILSSPFYAPMLSMNLLLMEKISLGKCQMCGSIFEIGKRGDRNHWTNLSRESLEKALRDEKGFMFWNYEVAKRKSQSRVRILKTDTTFERRYICPDCVYSVMSQMINKKPKKSKKNLKK